MMSLQRVRGEHGSMTIYQKMNKQIFKSALIFILLIGTLAGCAVQKTPTLSEIDAKIQQATNITEMKKGDAAKLRRFYGIKSGDVESFILYIAPSNIKADEIAVIKVKDIKDVDKIKGRVAQRIEKQSISFKDYLPDEYYLIEKNVLKVKGNYILFVVSKDAEKVSEAFDAAFK